MYDVPTCKTAEQMSGVVDFDVAVSLSLIVLSFQKVTVIDSVIDPIAEINGKETGEDN